MGDEKVDVLISGAGPVGLLLCYQLAQWGVSTCIIDAADKASPNFPMYGRACTLYPRTLEMLDQLDVFDEMADQGFIGRRNFSYKDGKKLRGRGWSVFEDINGTFFDFVLNLRLKYSEDIFRDRVAKLGSKVKAPVKLVELQLDENAKDDYKVTTTCASPDGRSFKVTSKYIVGSDGAGSAVRKLGNIPFTGADQEDHWVRIDGIVKTDLPDSRIGFGTVESDTHGQVLWVALDHGATRIGYVLSKAMYAKYGRHMKQEDAIKEAKAAIAPFELEFEHVDWHTVYTVKQFVADRFQDRERILLAGDAAHAHSSGTAQGMNTGTHDVCSLGWRLAGVIKGWYKREVLANYSDERRASAQKLIANDKIAAALISGHKPEQYKRRPEETNVLFGEFIKEEFGFTMGLGISYPPNLLNDVDGSPMPFVVRPGHIAPDCHIYKQGFLKGPPIRLFEATKYNGKFHILVFTGDVRDTHNRLKTLRRQVDTESARFDHAIEFRTIVFGVASAFGEYLGVEHFGKGFWDISREAHDRYRVSYESGAIAVLRPDGILGFVADLDGFDKVVAYLERIIVPRELKVITNGTHEPVGEMLAPDENNLYYKRANAEDVPESHEQGVVSPWSPSRTQSYSK